jgi:hypothetical protein
MRKITLGDFFSSDGRIELKKSRIRLRIGMVRDLEQVLNILQKTWR